MEASTLVGLTFLLNLELNTTQKILFIILETISDYKKETEVYNKELSKVLNIHPVNISNNLSKLQEKGFIKIDLVNDQFQGSKRIITILKNC